MFSHDLGDGAALRPWDPGDAGELYRVVDANRSGLADWMPWAATQTPEATQAFIVATRRQWAEGQAVEAAIVLDGSIAGGVGLNRIDAVNRSANVGYWLAAGARGRGLVTRAVAALLDEAFGPLRLHRVELRAGVENGPSRAVARRVGFAEEGISRGCERIGDRFIDHVVHGMLADDWPALRGRLGRP